MPTFLILACLTVLSPFGEDAAVRLELLTLASPAPAGSRHPTLARGADGRAYLAWTEVAGEGEALLGFATFEGGAPGRWRAPRRGPAGAEWFVNWADFPALSALADGSVAAFWLQRRGEGYDYAVRYRIARGGSEDWTEPAFLHEDLSRTEHGFVSVVPIEGGRFGAVWLDGRRTAGGGPMALYHRTLDADGARGEEVELDDRVCSCCQTDLVRLDDGALVVAYRDRGEDERRDVSVVRIAGGEASEPVCVFPDNWIFNGCPVNGPALAASGGELACAWYTEPEGPRVKLAFSGDGGRSFGSPRLVAGEDVLGRVDAAYLADGSLLVAWLQRTGAGTADWRVARFVAGERAGEPLTVSSVEPTRAAGFLRMLADGEGAFLAWTAREGEEYRVRCARVRLCANR